MRRGKARSISLSLGIILLAATSCFAQDQQAIRFQQFQIEGLKLLKAKEYNKAIENFKAALKEHPNSWQTWQNIALCHLRLGDYKSTISAGQKSIEIGGLHAPQCLTIAGAYEGLGEFQKALAWLKLACSVEPAQANNKIVQTKIRELKDPLYSPIGNLGAPDYLESLISATKWHLEDLPLKVFVRKNIQMPEFHAEFERLVRYAINQWCKATDNTISYKFVNSKESANLIFDYTESRERVSHDHAPGLDGSSNNRRRFSDGSVDRSNITVLVKDTPGGPSFRKSSMISKTLLHEIGHALGMHGHSPNPQDVMFSSTTQESLTALSRRDTNTIRRLYELPPSDPQLQAANYAKDNNFTKAIECFKTALNENPNGWITRQNIAICYAKLKDYDKAISYLQESIKIGGIHANQAINMAICCQDMGQKKKAWSWYRLASSLDPAIASDRNIQMIIRQLGTPIEHPPGSPSSSDYLSGIFIINRWGKEQMPLKVFVKPNPQIPGFYKTFNDLVRNALEQWCKATNGTVSYKFVEKPDSANLVWSYTDDRKDCTTDSNTGLGGATDLKARIADEKPEKANTIILVKDHPNGTFRDQKLLTRSCLHEMGHALGMNGHSPNNQDVMFVFGNKDDKVTLSERDKNTIKKLYPQ